MAVACKGRTLVLGSASLDYKGNLWLFFSGRLKFYPKALLRVDFFKAQGALTVGHVATQDQKQ